VDLPAVFDQSDEQPNRRISGGSPETKDSGATSERAKTVLYIEDNPANLELMKEIIGQLPSAAMVSAHTGPLGIELAKARKPDLILVDINLPGIDGFEVLDRIQTDVETKDIPVIAVSADVHPHDMKRGLSAGFKAYLQKPLSLVNARDAIKTAFDEVDTKLR